MNAKEAELVNEEFVALNSNYNLCAGGKGGWGYVNNNNLNGNIEASRKGGLKGGAVIKARSGEKRGPATTMWITNGLENKKVNKTLLLPVSWKRGRTILQNNFGRFK